MSRGAVRLFGGSNGKTRIHKCPGNNPAGHNLRLGQSRTPNAKDYFNQSPSGISPINPCFPQEFTTTYCASHISSVIYSREHKSNTVRERLKSNGYKSEVRQSCGWSHAY